MHIHRLEKYWLAFGMVMLAIFLIVVGVGAFVMGMAPPSSDHTDSINPDLVYETAPFDDPRIEQIGTNEYDVYMIAYAFGYSPEKLEIPLGAKVNFYITSPDVVHGFQIPGTNVNMMVVPGYVNTYTHTFNTSGEFLILCNEYCGAGHEFMATTLTVK